MIELYIPTPTSISITIWVTMVTMHFLIAEMSFLEHFFRIQEVPENNLASMKNCPGVQDMSN